MSMCEPGRVLCTGVYSKGSLGPGLRGTESSTGKGTGKQATAIECDGSGDAATGARRVPDPGTGMVPEGASV